MPPKPLKTAAEIAAEAAAKPQVPPGAPLRTAVQTAMTAPGPVAAPRTPFVNPGGQLTMGEFAAGGARPNMYGLYDPKGAANLRAALPFQANAVSTFNSPVAPMLTGHFSPPGMDGLSNSMRQLAANQRGYRPGQYLPPVAVPPAAAPAPTGGNSALAVRPNAAPATIPSAAPAMKAADVLNVRTIPGTGGQPALPPAAGGVGSRLMGAAGMVGKALPFVGDVLQGAAYGMDPNSNASTMDRIGRGLAAGVGSFGGRVAGALAGPVTSVAGSIGGAAGGAALYDQVTAEPSENERKALEGFGMSGQGGGSFGTPANRYSPNSGAPAVELQDEAAEFQKRMDMRTGDSPDARAARSQETPVQRIERGEVARRETKANYPSLSPEKAAAPKGEFKGPSNEEMARFRKQTGTPYDPKSITDKLNLERMRAGEQTFTSKQSREFRQSNPTYRPGQYVKRG